MSTVRPARTVVVRIKGPQGPSGTANLGTVTVVDPDQNPAVTATGTLRDRIFNFVLPRAAAFSVGSVSTGVNALDADVTDSGVDGDVSLDFTLPRSEISVGTVTEVNPDVTPAVSATTTDGDVALNFDLPRAPDFTVGTVTAVAQGSEAVTDVGANGDITLDFDVPKGDTGEQGIQGVQGDPGEGVPVGGAAGQVIVKQSGTDYDTAWEDPVAAIASLTDVDKGSGFEDGDILVYDNTGGVWIPGDPVAILG